MTTSTNRSPTLERVVIEPGDRTSMWLWRRDLDLLRALYGRRGGFSVHIRAATAEMCNRLRQQLASTPHGAELLRKLGQDQLP